MLVITYFLFFSLSLEVHNALRLNQKKKDATTWDTQSSSIESKPSGMSYDGQRWIIKPLRNGNENIALAKKPKAGWSPKYGCNTAPPAGSNFYSRGGEDTELYNSLFCGKTQGTYLEIGALDGKLFSNTKFFDDHLGWSGLLIEATPSNNEKIAANRPNPNNMIYKGGVCPDEQGNMKFAIAEGHNGGINGDPNQMSKKHNDAIHRKGTYREITVECRSLTTLIKEFVTKAGTSHIDLFSLDVEGGELLVLQNYDFSTPVKTFLVEMDDPSDPSDKEHADKDEAIRELFRSHGYAKHDNIFQGNGLKDYSEVWVLKS